MLTGDAGETSQACCGDAVLGTRGHAGLTGGRDAGSGPPRQEVAALGWGSQHPARLPAWSLGAPLSGALGRTGCFAGHSCFTCVLKKKIVSMLPAVTDFKIILHV